MNQGFIRVAAVAPAVAPADCGKNVGSIIEMLGKVFESGADIAVFPELCITGYTCADLFHNRTLLDFAKKGLRLIAESTSGWPGRLAVVGLPFEVNGTLYNCAAAVSGGKVVGIVPKTYLPDYNEFYEKRWWAPAPLPGLIAVVDDVDGRDPLSVPFGTDIIMDLRGVKVGVELCEDLWTAVPPSSRLSLAGAQVIVNLSASDDVIGKYDYLRGLVVSQSARCMCAYVYASAGYGESSTDLVFDSKLFVAENGRLLVSNRRWIHEPQSVIADVDIEAILRDRLHTGSFADCAAHNSALAGFRTIKICSANGSDAPELDAEGCFVDLMRTVDPRPFVPSGRNGLAERCEEIINIQTAALCRRLEATHCRSLTVGISGGLDSTLALLVATRAFDRLDIPRSGIIGVTMPGFGTTGRTHENALTLMTCLGVEIREIPIAAAVQQHFSDIGHDPSVHDVTYENSQARERTQILMDIANQTGGMVLGTGDLSELALGWATYNGDHISMYGVNAGVPKTLVRHLTQYFADEIADSRCRAALLDIIDTPISPELIPAAADGTIAQKTEDLVGPYELHDFFLYYTLRYGFAPRRIYQLARRAFGDTFEAEVVKKWIKVFFRRFFSQQFKRSCLPDGPKVGSVCLSPRGDWRMPSDASSKLWLDECESL